MNDAGYELHAGVFATLELDHLLSKLPIVERGGARSLLDLDHVQALARDPRLLELAGPHFFAVRALLFDKRPESNWGLTWHQDTTIAVRERVELPGFGPWTVKDGVPHTIAPSALLSRMVSLRVHLDDCGADAGPLRVKPGSHRHGRLSSAELEQVTQEIETVDCLAARGDVLRFSPLIVHGSTSSSGAAHRRVLQLEYACDELPGGLMWRWTR
jgi:hypothetical protein